MRWLDENGFERWREGLTDMQVNARHSSRVGLMLRKQRYTAFRISTGGAE
jgi:hypothetical protein